MLGSLKLEFSTKQLVVPGTSNFNPFPKLSIKLFFFVHCALHLNFSFSFPHRIPIDSTTFTVTACWNRSVTLDCGARFLSVEDAVFESALPANCSVSVPGLRPPACGADAWPVVNAVCGGRRACAFSTDATRFGDVCANLGKRLVITYSCLKGPLPPWLHGPGACPLKASLEILFCLNFVPWNLIFRFFHAKKVPR